MNLEVCVDNLESVQGCANGGVDRIELCACLADGGLTPSLGFLRAARRIFPGKIMAMLRPRGGDFRYSSGEIEMMSDEVEIMEANGADGIVFGVLQPDGQVARADCAKIMSRAGVMETVFHRAIDVSRDPLESLDVLIDLGVSRVLTSGGAADVQRGAEMLRKMVGQAAGRIEILAGGGLKLDCVADLIRITGLEGIHLSARKAYSGPMVFRHSALDFSPPGGSDHERLAASAEMILAARVALSIAND
jgi:copper homeostasis protein